MAPQKDVEVKNVKRVPLSSKCTGSASVIGLDEDKPVETVKACLLYTSLWRHWEKCPGVLTMNWHVIWETAFHVFIRRTAHALTK